MTEPTTGTIPEGAPWLVKYAVGAIRALLVAALIGVLAYQAVVRDTGPAISVKVIQVVAVPAGYTVRVDVSNEGGTTAEGVVISGRLTRDGREVDQASTTASYVPPDSMRTVSLISSRTRVPVD